MIEQNWILLADYSQKYHVSVSTLRRRIKNTQVEYIYCEGRYQLKDIPLESHNPMPAHRPLDDHIASPQNEASCQMGAVADNFLESKSGHQANLASSSNKNLELTPTPSLLSVESDRGLGASVPEREIGGASVLSTANNMLAELKSAYITALQNKEEQIMSLKGEVMDLKTLVRVLESETARLKVQLSEAAPIDKWLDSLNED